MPPLDRRGIDGRRKARCDRRVAIDADRAHVAQRILRAVDILQPRCLPPAADQSHHRTLHLLEEQIPFAGRRRLRLVGDQFGQGRADWWNDRFFWGHDTPGVTSRKASMSATLLWPCTPTR